jgi:hypothetical protein
MPQKIDFKNWWDEKYFYADGHHRPLYNVYLKLDKAGADLDHIEAFCNCLRLGDLFGDLLLSKRTKSKRKSLAIESRAEKLNKAIAEAIDGVEQRFRSPLGAALNEFFLPHILHVCWSRGKKVDMWGSFFLLVVTEYMKSTRGKPRYRLVDDLLRSVRNLLQAQLGLPGKSALSPDGRSRAAVRIEKLKRKSALFRFIALELSRRSLPPQMLNK